jgi:nitronate monooxygenase
MSLLEQLGIKLPILLAPMAGVSTPLLAAEVSNQGALGSLGLGQILLKQHVNKSKKRKT